MLLLRLWSLIWLLRCWALGTRAEVQADPKVNSIPLRTHSLAPPYLDSDMQSRWFDFGGNTIIRADQYIRLTSDRPSQEGWIFSRVPLTATNWEVEFEFAIHGAGNLHGDGFAMWITKQRATPGPVFGSTDRFEGLGIFFDTYKNNRPGVVFPYVMAMMGDGQTTYDKENDGKANEIAGCSARGLRAASVPTKAKLTYYQDKSLTLQLQYKIEDTWTECFSLTPESTHPTTKQPISISIPSVAYLGFSAETGELSDNFDIINVEARNLYTASGYMEGNAGSRRPDPKSRKKYLKEREGGGWSEFLLKIVMFGFVVAGCYVGYTAYRSNKRTRF